ncbi:MAG: DUF535 family protein [Pseudomonadota bacterium]
MNITEKKHPQKTHLNFLRCFKQLSSYTRRFASDFFWAYRTVFHSHTIGYQRRGRFVMRTVLNLGPSAFWFRFMRSSYLNGVAANDPSLIEAIHRPFFDRTVNASRRVLLLKSHFESLYSIFGPLQTGEMMVGARMPLCHLVGKNGEAFAVNLFRGDAFKREGGVTLELSFENHSLLFLTFTLVDYDDEILIKVGGIQSNKGDTRDQVRDATHALHGIQPRLLLIEALRAIASRINCTKIECVGKENHIHKAWRYRFKKTFSAEYDQLWRLAGGKENRKGNFDIPATVEEKSIDARPSNKRSEYRRRSVLLHAMRHQVEMTMQGTRVYQCALEVA